MVLLLPKKGRLNDEVDEVDGFGPLVELLRPNGGRNTENPALFAGGETGLKNSDTDESVLRVVGGEEGADTAALESYGDAKKSRLFCVFWVVDTGLKYEFAFID